MHVNKKMELKEKNEQAVKAATWKLKKEIQQLTTHLREEIHNVNEPQAKALFEVSAEVLQGLYKAFGDYESKNEAAWTDSREYD